MAVYRIVEEGDQILREKAVTVKKMGRNIEKLLDNMKDTMYAYKGIGLAAPQIGVSKRVITVDTGDGLLELINPRIIKSEGTQTGDEGCLSIPQVMGEVTRALRVWVTGLDRQGQEFDLEAEGYLAVILQHEIDHLDGILFTDKVSSLRKI